MRLHRVLLTLAVISAVAASLVQAVHVGKISVATRRQRLAELTQHHAGAATDEKVMTVAATIPSPHKREKDDTIEATLMPRKGEHIDRQTVMNDKKFLAAELIDDYPQRFSKFTTLLEMRNVPATFRVSPKLLEMHRRASSYRGRERDEDDEDERQAPADEADDDEEDGGDEDMRFRDEEYAPTPAAHAAAAHAAAPHAAGSAAAPAAGAAPGGTGAHAGPYVSPGFYASPPPPPPLPVDLPPPPYIPPLMETAMPVAEAKAISATTDDTEVVTNIS